MKKNYILKSGINSSIGLLYGVIIDFLALSIGGGGHGFLLPQIISFAPFSLLYIPPFEILKVGSYLLITIVYWPVLALSLSRLNRSIYKYTAFFLIFFHYIGVLFGICFYISFRENFSSLEWNVITNRMAWFYLYLTLFFITYIFGQVIIIYSLVKSYSSME